MTDGPLVIVLHHGSSCSPDWGALAGRMGSRGRLERRRGPTEVLCLRGLRRPHRSHGDGCCRLDTSFLAHPELTGRATCCRSLGPLPSALEHVLDPGPELLSHAFDGVDLDVPHLLFQLSHALFLAGCTGGTEVHVLRACLCLPVTYGGDILPK